MISIDIISDTVCPWCFIGKKRLEKAIEKSNNLNFNINWHSFQLNPEMPIQGMDRKIYLLKKFGSSSKADDLYSHIKESGISSGINFVFEKITKMPNSFNSHLLIEFAKEKNLQNIIVEELFKAYFLLGKNIGDSSILSDVAINSGIKNFIYEDLLARKDLVESIKNSDLNNKNMGISGVPFFIFNKSIAVSGAQESEVFEKVFETCMIGKDIAN